MAGHGHELFEAYQVLVGAALAETGRGDADPRTMTEVVFALVDGMILRRVHNPGLDGDRLAPAVRDAVLKMVS